MTENPDKTRTGRDEDGSDRDKDAAASTSPAGDLSSKLDPDFIPQQADSPEAERTRENPEETGS